MPRRLARGVAHKSTGGILPKFPAPVDPVGNAPERLTLNTVAHPHPLPTKGEGRQLHSTSKAHF